MLYRKCQSMQLSEVVAGAVSVVRAIVGPFILFPAIAGSAFFLGGCSGMSTSNQPADQQYKSWMPVLGRNIKDGGGILVATQFIDPNNAVSSEGCRLRVQNQNTGRSLFIDVKADQPGSIVNAEPGHYVTTRLGCGLTSVWNLEDLYGKGFDVQKGELSYIGKLIFNFNAKADLESVKKGSRIENAASLKQLMNSVAKNSDDSLISGFTKKPITKSMIDAAPREGFDVFALGVQEANQQVLRPLLDTLKTCSQQAQTADPLRFGELEYVAVYKLGKFDAIRDRKDNNTLSDELRSCIERSLKNFNSLPPKGEVRIRVRY